MAKVPVLQGMMRLVESPSEGDRLQQLRAVLPCEVRVVAETHPLFGRLLAAKSFKRWNGVLLLVVELPDGSAGTVRADATNILAADPAAPVASVAPTGLVLDGDGVQTLQALVAAMQRRPGIRSSGK